MFEVLATASALSTILGTVYVFTTSPNTYSNIGIQTLTKKV